MVRKLAVCECVLVQRALLLQVYVRHDGLCATVVSDKDYPVRVAFSLIQSIMADYDRLNGGKWKQAEKDVDEYPDNMKVLLQKYQVSSLTITHPHAMRRCSTTQWISFQQQMHSPSCIAYCDSVLMIYYILEAREGGFNRKQTVKIHIYRHSMAQGK